MHHERLARFSRERLDGRPVPEDVQTLLVTQWEGRTDFTSLLGLVFLGEGEVHLLLDTSYLNEDELADPEMQAINAAAMEMAQYVKLVAKGGKGWIGYWLHPGEPADPSWPLIELGTEFTFRRLNDLTLAEGVVAECASRQEELDTHIAFAQLAAELAQMGLLLGAQERDVPREAFMEELIEAEREKRGLH
ncbi:hypothetical protein [Streptomyces sp. NPDC088752]|uniref:hypothetical protein n=1 Tax=Streptomyces sp. NPDC088752 TaxID=3154963 RepID=UPI0034336C26